MSIYVARSPWPVFYHRWRLYLNTWRGTVFSSFLLPVMFLLGLGVSVGSYVDDRVLGMPYANFIAPGVLASTAFQVAINEAAWPVLGGFKWVRTYHAMRASPLRPVDMAVGEILWIWLRAGTSAAGFLVVLTLFGIVRSPVALLTVPAVLLLAVASCTPVLAYSASIRTDNWFSFLFRFAVIPMTLFAGVFFPVEQLPLVPRWVAYASPLWHGVELCRAATLGTPTAIGWLGHAAYLALWAVVGYLLAAHRFTRRLTD
ncbi:MAG: ABC transporter permease [Micromonosporaceae bacterium]|nr:ABC transporter permease [Micromonosporaceae bacterium]